MLLLCVQAPEAHAESRPRGGIGTQRGCLHHRLPASPGPHHITCFSPAAFRQARPQGAVGPVGRQRGRMDDQGGGLWDHFTPEGRPVRRWGSGKAGSVGERRRV